MKQFKSPILWLIIAITAVAIYALKPKPNTAGAGTPIVSVTVPTTLGANAKMGQGAFETHCAACHGVNAVGQVGIAPPLIHKIYEPSHHGDLSFARAAKFGVQAHHWPFGNMAPVDGITDNEIISIITYIRELQRANGIG